MSGPGRTVADAMLTEPRTSGPDTTLAEVRELFAEHHVHAALIVDADRLLAVVEPADLASAAVAGPAVRRPAARVGGLEGRTVAPDADLDAATAAMAAAGRRRLAVTDPDGRLLGLLCIKRRGDGYCTDDDVAARAADPR